jgi:hypothetical protein
MTPSVGQTTTINSPQVTKSSRVPLKSSGSLDKFEKFDVTPVIGTEFKGGVQLVDLLLAPNSDELIRDLAILGIFMENVPKC